MIQVLIAAAILVIYVTIMSIANKQLPTSLSASVFNLPPAGAWIWTLVIAAIVFLIAPGYFDTLGAQYQWLGFLACTGLLFVAGAPLVKDKSDIAYKVHMAGAILCAVASQAAILCVEPNILFIWAFWIFTWIFFTIDRQGWRTKIFWAEMICFADTFVFILLHI